MIGETATLQPLEAKDQAFLDEMAYEALRGTVGDISSHEEPAAMRLIASYVGDWGGRTLDTGLIAQNDSGEAIGAAWYRVDPDRFTGIDNAPPFRPVLSMAVRPESRGRGVGRTLLEGLMDHASATGVRFLSLSVALDNKAAKELYKSVGFTDDRYYLAGFGPRPSAPAMKMSAPTARP